MAKFSSSFLGKVRKSVGNITTCYMNKENIAKAKIFSRKDVKTPEVLMQRAKMKLLTTIVKRILPVIRKGFAGVGRGTTSNAFTSLNMAAVQVDEKYVATMDFEKMLCAYGMIYAPKVSVAYDGENEQYTFTQEMQEREDGFALPDDKVYAVMYEEVLNRVKLITLKDRGENGSTVSELPEEWDASNVHLYCFATTRRGNSASDSRYLRVD